MMESKTLRIDDFFNARFYSVSIKLFTGSDKISQKRFVSSEVHLGDGCFFSISLFYFIFTFCSSGFLCFQILDVLFLKIKQHLKA